MTDQELEHAYQASLAAAVERRRLMAAQESFITETVFNHPSKVDLVAHAVALGYLVPLHGILVPASLPVPRVAFRAAQGDFGMNPQPAQPQTDQRSCRFPGCTRAPAAPEPGATGRPPEYCPDPAHTNGAAWRARERQRRETGQPVETRPVDAARARAGEITAQLTGMPELLTQQLAVAVEQLHTLADPDAAQAQIEAVASEAAEQVATANARALRAQAASRQAGRHRDRGR